MPIHCMCPNGHRMAVHDRFAGATTKCRRCGETLKVPAAADGELTDTGILRLLGDYDPVDQRPAQPRSRLAAPEQECPRCRRSVPRAVRICPACNVYLPLPGKAAG